ncbi:hypothetical protein [Moorena producens]|uniref:hypothetical protein n=1 Tax=Moorena producens TaxID=1155739 RepID=UPI0011EA62A9|nr:hypothetical protein [Moorena producens]
MIIFVPCCLLPTPYSGDLLFPLRSSPPLLPRAFQPLRFNDLKESKIGLWATLRDRFHHLGMKAMGSM